MSAEMIALIGVVASSTIGGFVAFTVAARKFSADRKSFEQQHQIQVERQFRDLLTERSERKLDIAYKYAELHQKDIDAAALFLNEVAKETAIGFLYLDDNDTKDKIWIRNDANILVGRASVCDVTIPDGHVSRQHCVIHTSDNIPFVIPLNPTNPVILDGNPITQRTQLNNGSLLTIGSYKFIYFEL